MPNSMEIEQQNPTRTLAEQQELLNQARVETLALDSEAFEQNRHVCTCIDEGTPGDFRLAGAGILDPDGFDHAVALMRQAGVTKVESHAQCGAVALAARKIIGPAATPEEIDALGRSWATDVAAALGVPTEHRLELERPVDEHDASVIYVDLVGGFRPDQVPEKLPKGFVISGVPTPAKLVAKQVRVAADISFSEHGLYGDQFSDTTPLHIVLVSAATAGPEHHHLVEELHQAVKEYGPRVYVDQIDVK